MADLHKVDSFLDILVKNQTKQQQGLKVSNI